MCCIFVKFISDYDPPPKKNEKQNDDDEWDQYLRQAEEELVEDYLRILKERADYYQELIDEYSDGNNLDSGYEGD